MPHINSGWLSGVLLGVALYLPVAEATDKPQVDLQSQQNLLAGHLIDGQRIAQGRITSHDTHIGFQVWCEDGRTDGNPDGCILRGMQRNNNQVKVRLEQNGWRKDTKGGKGIILNTQDDTAIFYVVIDGEQTVISDKYRAEIRGVSLVR